MIMYNLLKILPIYMVIIKMYFVYHIGTLPMPPVPPPPLEGALRSQRYGPPHHLKNARTATAPSGGCDPAPGHIGNYAEVDAFEDFEPHFLVQTSSGNVFVPSGTNYSQI